MSRKRVFDSPGKGQAVLLNMTASCTQPPVILSDEVAVATEESVVILSGAP